MEENKRNKKKEKKKENKRHPYKKGGKYRIKHKIPKGEKYLVLLMFFLIVSIIGSFMNIGAVVNNDCQMPVKATYGYETETHFSYSNNSEIDYFYLSDFLNMEFENTIIYFSLGDVIIFIGIFGMIFHSTKYVIFNYRRKKWKKNNLKKQETEWLNSIRN